jgi:hypothetical protein
MKSLQLVLLVIWLAFAFLCCSNKKFAVNYPSTAAVDSSIVLIDIANLSRKEIADCILQLNAFEAKVIGVDVLFKGRTNWSVDSTLASAIAQAENIILLVNVDGEGNFSRSDSLFSGNPDNEGLGSLHFYDDSQVLSHYVPLYESSEQMINFGDQVAFAYDDKIIENVFKTYEINESIDIEFTRRPEEFVGLTMGQLTKRNVQGKIILLGDLSPGRSFEVIIRGEKIRTNSTVVYANIVRSRLGKL